MIRVLATLLLACAGLAAQNNQIRFHDGVFTVTAIEPPEPAGGWAAVFPIYVSGNESQPMLGTYTLEGDTLTFRPRFPLAPGIAYHALLRSKSTVIAEASFDPPPAPPPSTRVTAIYPSADQLPANTLRLYIHFSAPMSRGEAWQHIHLRTEAGEEARLAFLEIDQELWDAELQRLTVLFDPGRIKRGLVPARELGAPLQAGVRYRLSIDKDWHDARGVPLAEGFEKTFTGVAAERTQPAPQLWRITAPRAGTLEPLVITFPRPMDRALLERMIQVEGVAGSVAISKNETEFRFTPLAAWKRGRYRIWTLNTIEDIAGNTPGRAFDTELAKNAPSTGVEKTITLPLRIR